LRHFGRYYAVVATHWPVICKDGNSLAGADHAPLAPGKTLKTVQITLSKTMIQKEIQQPQPIEKIDFIIRFSHV